MVLQCNLKCYMGWAQIATVQLGYLSGPSLMHSSAFSSKTTYFSSSRVMAYSALIGGRSFQEKGWGQLAVFKTTR